MKIPLEMQKIKDPDGSTQFRAIIFLQDAIGDTARSQTLIHIQNTYVAFVRRCHEILRDIQQNRKHMSDSKVQWELADTIYMFVKNVENYGFIFINYIESISRDVRISKSQLRYLIKFRTYYPSIKDVSKQINWSKYRELLDFPNQKSKKECEDQILNGRIRTDTEIREYKRKIKARKIP